jgi:sugar-specific transcriptional regulator TrmB
MSERAEAPLHDQVLRHVGVSALEERVYVVLLDHPGATLAQLAALADLPKRRLRPVLGSLEDHGLISRSPERVHRYLPSPPTVAVDALIAQQEEAMQHTRLAALRLEDRLRGATNPDPASAEIVQIVNGREAAARHYTQIEQAAREEVLVFDRPPYYTTDQIDAINDTEKDSLARGVRWRAVYAQESLTLPGGYAHVRKSIAMGEEARVMAQLPLKLTLADRATGAVPLDLRHPDLGGGTLIVRTSSLLDALHVLFEFVWERATPLRLTSSGEVADHPPVPGSASGAQDLLSLLAAGLKDETIARQFGVATRTIERRMQTLMRDLDATTRFQAGWLAATRDIGSSH